MCLAQKRILHRGRPYTVDDVSAVEGQPKRHKSYAQILRFGSGSKVSKIWLMFHDTMYNRMQENEVSSS
jgi:hypothetical protein